MLLICDNCGYKADNFNILKKHYYHHRGNRNGKFVCHENGCGTQYSNYKKLEMHFYRMHSKKKMLPVSTEIINASFLHANSPQKNLK